MRIVLDTNVIVAAFAARGLCADVFEVCLENHTIIISEFILSEVEKTLTRKIGLPKTTAIDTSACRDKDDVKIIGTALKGKAKIIITGDEDLLILKKYKNTAIVTPREFWGLLKG
jgi:predicted nucleic acid-binding protein